MIVGVLRTCHTQYTSFSRCNPMWFISMGLRQESGLCSSSSPQVSRNWRLLYATNSLEQSRLSGGCL